MSTRRDQRAEVAAGPTTRGADPAASIEPAVATEREVAPVDSTFPLLPQAPVASNLRKAQVRAALFRKLEPVRVGRFILLEPLGEGAMGEIYAAYDEQLDRRVALKLVRHGSDLTARADGLLLREAQSLAKVSHPNVVQIYEAGTHNGRLFIAMELIHGQTLSSWLGEAARMPRPLRQREILRKFIAAGRGLEAAHAAGVAHRDFKPDNVLVGVDGRVRVVDFGLARALVEDPGAGAPAARERREPLAAVDDITNGQTVKVGPARGAASQVRFATGETTLPHDPGSSGIPETGSPDAQPAADERRALTAPSSSPPRLKAASRLTETGTALGTPRFMAPEQIRGAVADQRSDQFSFCVSLYHALYGAFPFAGESLQELHSSMESGAVGLEHSVGVAAGVRRALRRGLSVDASERFASMGELLAALEPSARRRRGWIAGAVLVFLVAGVVMLLRMSAATDPCIAAGGAIDPSWSVPRQAAMHVGFLGSELPYAEAAWRGVKARLDGYTQRWRDDATAACRATFTTPAQSVHQLDKRMLCLDRGRRQVEALVSELGAGAPDAVLRAVEAAEALPDLQACNSTENLVFGLEPPPALVSRDVAEIRDQLARARTLGLLGRIEESLVLARQTREIAERLSYLPVQAEAIAQVASALDGRGTADALTEAERLYFEALGIAEGERHDELSAEIWNRLVLLAVRMDAGTQRAHAWWQRNAASVKRLGNSALAQANLHHMLAEIHYRDSKYAEAADAENRANAAISRAPEHQLELSRYYDALAKSLVRLDRIDEALRLHERALGIATDALGVAHPNLIKLQINYGKALEKHGNLDRARAVLEAALGNIPAQHRAAHQDAGRLHSFLSDLSYTEWKLDDAAAHATESLEIYQRAGAPEHVRAQAYTNLGNVELRRRNFAGALARYEQALALRRRYLASDHFQIGVTEGSIANALVELMRYDEALLHVLEAERIFQHGSARDRATLGWIQTVHGEALVGQRRFGAAVPVLEQALRLCDGASQADNLASASWALARALHGLRADAGRVRQLAERAHALFATLGPAVAGSRDAVGAFLKRLLPLPESRVLRTGDRLDR
jgi:serine/threonine protein kinase/tetratricopeptide (TPR) repeat protein